MKPGRHEGGRSAPMVCVYSCDCTTWLRTGAMAYHVAVHHSAMACVSGHPVTMTL